MPVSPAVEDCDAARRAAASLRGCHHAPLRLDSGGAAATESKTGTHRVAGRLGTPGSSSTVQRSTVKRAASLFGTTKTSESFDSTPTPAARRSPLDTSSLHGGVEISPRATRSATSSIDQQLVLEEQAGRSAEGDEDDEKDEDEQPATTFEVERILRSGFAADAMTNPGSSASPRRVRGGRAPPPRRDEGARTRGKATSLAVADPKISSTTPHFKRGERDGEEVLTAEAETDELACGDCEAEALAEGEGTSLGSRVGSADREEEGDEDDDGVLRRVAPPLRDAVSLAVARGDEEIERVAESVGELLGEDDELRLTDGLPDTVGERVASTDADGEALGVVVGEGEREPATETVAEPPLVEAVGETEPLRVALPPEAEGVDETEGVIDSDDAADDEGDLVDAAVGLKDGVAETVARSEALPLDVAGRVGAGVAEPEGVAGPDTVALADRVIVGKAERVAKAVADGALDAEDVAAAVAVGATLLVDAAEVALGERLAETLALELGECAAEGEPEEDAVENPEREGVCEGDALALAEGDAVRKHEGIRGTTAPERETKRMLLLDCAATMMPPLPSSEIPAGCDRRAARHPPLELPATPEPARLFRLDEAGSNSRSVFAPPFDMKNRALTASQIK
jgi:hypothetical protein